MNLSKLRRLAVLAALLPGACAFFPGRTPPASPLLGTWSTADHNKVIFRADAVVVAPEQGPSTTMSAADCNGRYKLLYGRMATAPLAAAFASQPDLQNKLKRLLPKPEYMVADVTCGDGGTTYLMLDDRQMIAVYRDAGIGGVEQLTRL